MDACLTQHMSKECAIQRLRVCGEIWRRLLEIKLCVQRVHSEDIFVYQGSQVVWGTRAIVFRAEKQIVKHLLAEGASGNTGIHGKLGRGCRDVVHAPVGE